MAVEELRGRVHHDVSAKLDGLLEIGRHERVVDHHLAAAFMSDRADRGDVGEPHQRVGRRLDIHVARVLADGALHIARVGCVHVGELEAEVRHDLVEQPRHAAVEIVRGDDMVTGLHELAHRDHGGHTAGKHWCGNAAFQGREILLQPGARGIAGARVVVAFGYAQLFLRVGGSGKNRRSDGAGRRIGVVADVDGASGKSGSVLLGHKNRLSHGFARILTDQT